MFGLVAATWGFVGVVLLLGNAIYRLSLVGSGTFSHPLLWYHWAALIVWVMFMAYKEGYSGFQRSFSPRVAARVVYLRNHPTLSRALLAPLFCIGFFHIERRRQFLVVMLTIMILGFVAIAHQLSQPWRGIVDLGVVVGLLWGVVSFGISTLKAFDEPGRYSPYVP